MKALNNNFNPLTINFDARNFIRPKSDLFTTYFLLELYRVSYLSEWLNKTSTIEKKIATIHVVTELYRKER